MSKRRGPTPKAGSRRAGGLQLVTVGGHDGQADDGLYDGCPVCEAMRSGDDAAVIAAFFRDPEAVRWES